MKRQPLPSEPLPVWESEQLYTEGDRWFVDLLAAIGRARHSIQLQTYIFELDSTGQAFLQALRAASERGVRVQVMVDGVGSHGSASQLARVLQVLPNAELRVFHPLPWQLFAISMERSHWARRFFSRLQRVNRRQHSKLCLIDGNEGWVGSFNIVDPKLPDGSDRLDCGACVTGARCQLFDEFFQALWHLDTGRLSSRFLLHSLVNLGPALRRRHLRALLTLIHGARERIWISSGYFAPVPQVVRALKKARARGVDVRIVVPTITDIPFFPALSATYYADLLRADIHIHLCAHGMLHEKTLMIDQRAFVGSSNMNHRSVLHDVELDIELYSPAAISALEAHFVSYWQADRMLNLQSFSRFSAWLLVLGQIPRLLRYWM